MKREYTSLGRDLYFKAQCTCPDKKWADKPTVAHMFKTKITLTGYYDDNFFDNVHNEPKEGACECGKKFKYQWFRDGVLFDWVK